MDESLDDDDTLIEEQEEEDADVTDIIGGEAVLFEQVPHWVWDDEPGRHRRRPGRRRYQRRTAKNGKELSPHHGLRPRAHITILLIGPVVHHSELPLFALGHYRTFSEICVMSALPPKAGIAKRRLDLRFVP